MSLSSETQRVQQGVKDTLKTLIQKLGGTVSSERVDGYPSLANAISNKLLPDNLLSADTAALYGKGAEATPNEIFSAISALMQEKAEVHLFSYVGTGTYSGSFSDGGVSITAEKPILVIGILLQKSSAGAYEPSISKDYSSDEISTIMETSQLSTTYTAGIGLGFYKSEQNTTLYAKKSSDGKTVSWTNEDASPSQNGGSNSFNQSGKAYYGFYIC